MGIKFITEYHTLYYMGGQGKVFILGEDTVSRQTKLIKISMIYYEIRLRRVQSNQDLQTKGHVFVSLKKRIKNT